MAVYLANAFSLGMIANLPTVLIRVTEIPIEVAREYAKDAVSVVGHEATAVLLSQLLEWPVSVNRATIQLKPGDVLIVFQLLERLPEGKVLSEEELRKLKFKFFLVEVLRAAEMTNPVA